MAIIKKGFTNFNGIDLKNSDIIRDESYASDVLNVIYRKNKSLSKRAGSKYRLTSRGGCGMFLYNHQDVDTGLFDKQYLTVDDNLYRRTKTTISISYSGSSLTCMLFNTVSTQTNTYHVRIQEGTNIVLDFDCGKGYDEATIKTLTNLATAINTLGNFTATINGDGNIPAAFLEVCYNVDLKSGAKVLTAYSWQQVYSPITNPFSAGYSRLNASDFQLYTFAQANNVVYIANGYDDLMKYDGQSVYKAGMPKLEINSLNGVAGGSLTALGKYEYQIVATYYDAAGNLIEGNISDQKDYTLLAGQQSIDIAVKNIIASSGFNTNCAIINGDQNNVTTINVQAGHTLQVGDTAYFWDDATSSYVTRKITNRTNTSISFTSGNPVNVKNNAVISANLRIAIYRTIAVVSPYQTKYLVAEIPNNSFNSVQSYVDTLSDSVLESHVELVTPIKLRDLPPKGKYINFFYNQLCICGNPQSPNIGYYSDIDSPEYFPPENQFLLQSKNGDPLTGCIQNNESFIFTEKKAIHLISGDISTDNVRVETITSDIGCISHHTMQEIAGELVFLSDRGVYKITSGSLVQNIGDKIEPIFDYYLNALGSNQIFDFSRAIAINHRRHNYYIIYIPCKSEESGNISYNSNSRLYVYDYSSNAWLVWSDINMGGGGIFDDDVMMFTERVYSGYSSSLSFKSSIELNTMTKHDYVDHVNGIDFKYKTGWYHEGEPTIFKKYLRFKLFSLRQTGQNSFNIDLSFETDFYKDLSKGSVVIDMGNVLGYGLSPYGIAPYGDVSINQKIVKVGPIKAQSIRFILENDVALENVDITGWEIEYEASYKGEMKQ